MEEKPVRERMYEGDKTDDKDLIEKYSKAFGELDELRKTVVDRLVPTFLFIAEKVYTQMLADKVWPGDIDRIKELLALGLASKVPNPEYPRDGKVIRFHDTRIRW